MKKARRAFVSGSGLALAGVATGAITGLTSSSVRANTPPNLRVASFGWEVTNLDNNGADVYFQVRSSMTLISVNIDTAFMITSPPSGALASPKCCAERRFPVALRSSSTAIREHHLFLRRAQFRTRPRSTIPISLNLVNDGFVLQDIFYNIILKTWVPR